MVLVLAESMVDSDSASSYFSLESAEDHSIYMY